jgi:2-oxoglutarate ferredoxin oxidoreductase subunit beta
MAYLQERHAAGEVVTGLLYIEDDAQDLHAHLKTVSTPLNKLAEADLCPGSKALDSINASYR